MEISSCGLRGSLSPSAGAYLLCQDWASTLFLLYFGWNHAEDFQNPKQMIKVPAAYVDRSKVNKTQAGQLTIIKCWTVSWGLLLKVSWCFIFTGATSVLFYIQTAACILNLDSCWDGHCSKTTCFRNKRRQPVPGPSWVHVSPSVTPQS